MKIEKKIQGIKIDMEIKKIKDYGSYGLYQVYKIQNNERIPLYKETYKNKELEEMAKNIVIIEEV